MRAPVTSEGPAATNGVEARIAGQVAVRGAIRDAACGGRFGGVIGEVPSLASSSHSGREAYRSKSS